MKRTLITAALLAAIPVCYGQASSNTPGPITGSTGAGPIGPGGSSVGQTIQSQPGPGGSSVGQTIQGTPSSIPSQPLPPTPPSQPAPLGGTGLQPGVVGTPAPASPCIGSVGMSGCAPAQ